MSRILVVDDTRNIRKMVGLTLSRAGHQVVGAEDGKRGLAAFGNGSQWDLTLLDERMPFVSGREVAHDLARRDPGTRVILMTAFATMDMASDVIANGALDFLRKPFSTDTLRLAVDKALAQPLAFQIPDEVEHELGAARPQIVHQLKGFEFWPVWLEETATPPGLEVARPFWVQSRDEKRRTLVGVTPHVREQIHLETGMKFDAQSHLWTTICEMALTQFLLENGAVPPRVLPIYELTSSQIATVQIIGRDMRFNGF